RNEIARHRCKVPQGVVCVRVVDSDSEWLAAIDALEASRDARKIKYAFGNCLRRTISRECSGRRSEHVVDIYLADQRRPHRDSLRRRDHLEARSPRRGLDRFGVEVTRVQAIRKNYRAVLFA